MNIVEQQKYAEFDYIKNQFKSAGLLYENPGAVYKDPTFIFRDENNKQAAVMQDRDGKFTIIKAAGNELAATGNLSKEQVVSKINDILDKKPIIAKRNENIKNTINEMNEFVKRKNFRPDRSFLQPEQGDFSKLHQQGFKIHVSFDTLDDYKKYLPTLVNELDRTRTNYKIVKPEKFENRDPGKNLYGKAVTIYPDERFSLDNFSKEFRSILRMDVKVKSQTDKETDYKNVTVRFGSFKSEFLIDNNGRKQEDLRKAENAFAKFLDMNKLWAFDYEKRFRLRTIENIYKEAAKLYGKDFEKYKEICNVGLPETIIRDGYRSQGTKPNQNSYEYAR